jgi:hypothetical protein
VRGDGRVPGTCAGADEYDPSVRPYAADSPARAEFEEALTVARGTGDPMTLGVRAVGIAFAIDPQDSEP